MVRVLIVLIALTLATDNLKAAELLALKGLDPVELSAGRELAGKETLTATAGRFLYRFSTEANLTAFRKSPERYSIQFGGACMKMGPLSGYGSPERWDVYDGKIYLFASEGCRTAFRAKPSSFIDKADEVVSADETSEKQARDAMDAAVTAIGGRDRLKALKTWQVKSKLTQPLRDGKTFVYYRTFVASFADRTAAEWEHYDDVKYGWVSSPKDSFRTSTKEWELVDSQVADFMRREVARHPLWLLKAWLDGRAKVAFRGMSPDGSIRLVAISLDGASTTIGIDTKSGHIVSTSYRGRAAVGISNVERQYSDVKQIQGIKLPHATTTKIDGKVTEGGTKVEIESMSIDEAIPSELLRKPNTGTGRP